MEEEIKAHNTELQQELASKSSIQLKLVGLEREAGNISTNIISQREDYSTSMENIYKDYVESIITYGNKNDNKFEIN